jgi:thiol-disulfide isomerase/thioredoxin
MLKKIHVLTALVLFTVLGLCGGGCSAAARTRAAHAFAPAMHWDQAIEWHAYETGLARARVERKPILLVFYADWCPPCKEFHHVFDDARVIGRAKDFVMIHVNGDQREDVAKKFDVHNYPRTYFLTADGVLLRGARPASLCPDYDYDHKDPASLLAGMEYALNLASDPAVRPDEDRAPPPPVTAVELCAHEARDASCDVCLKGPCCAALVACGNDAACFCTQRPRGSARDSMTACLKDHCPEQCAPLLKGLLLKPPSDGAP